MPVCLDTINCRKATKEIALWCTECLRIEIIKQRKELNYLEQYLCPCCEKPKMECDRVDENQLCGGPCYD